MALWQLLQNGWIIELADLLRAEAKIDCIATNYHTWDLHLSENVMLCSRPP